MIAGEPYDPFDVGHWRQGIRPSPDQHRRGGERRDGHSPSHPGEVGGEEDRGHPGERERQGLPGVRLKEVNDLGRADERGGTQPATARKTSRRGEHDDGSRHGGDIEHHGAESNPPVNAEQAFAREGGAEEAEADGRSEEGSAAKALGGQRRDSPGEEQAGEETSRLEPEARRGGLMTSHDEEAHPARREGKDRQEASNHGRATLASLGGPGDRRARDMAPYPAASPSPASSSTTTSFFPHHCGV